MGHLHLCSCGYRAWLGDGLNGYEGEGEFQDLTDAIVFLAREAVRRYPDSPFAEKYAELASGRTPVRASAHPKSFFGSANKGPGSEPPSLDAPGVDIVAEDLHGLDHFLEQQKKRHNGKARVDRGSIVGHGYEANLIIGRSDHRELGA
ncbi:hypothetical protein [Rhodoligotrophos defluvii]|uniref:hypothetical protein n=1 Tax=Rhodoligotrophos defluvii TaxID=2561934 RepID=UPI0010CA0301|nr:hypothetical protein [Rhodoligotrophos defluvii]